MAILNARDHPVHFTADNVHTLLKRINSREIELWQVGMALERTDSGVVEKS